MAVFFVPNPGERAVMLAQAPQQAKSVQVATRYSTADHGLIATAAEARGMTFGEFVRTTAVDTAMTILETGA